MLTRIAPGAGCNWPANASAESENLLSAGHSNVEK
jgi:hypothetical protein